MRTATLHLVIATRSEKTLMTTADLAEAQRAAATARRRGTLALVRTVEVSVIDKRIAPRADARQNDLFDTAQSLGLGFTE